MDSSSLKIMEELQSFITTYGIFILAITVVSIIAYWKIFTKAGRPGWNSIVPIYSQYVLFEMVGMKGWYVFLIFIPLVGAFVFAVLSLVAYYNLAKCFGKSSGFGVGLIFLPIIFSLILGFDNSKYTKPSVNE